MRIERIELDGFGRFHDAHWALDDGLTIFVGANEAGKTTLLNAVRALLFGFEATRDGRTWYPAIAGGRRGGRLTLRTAAGQRWGVERHGERGGAGALAVRAPNGNQGGQETLDRLLHGADRDLFNNIFAFGLSELQTLASLSADGVRGRIYGAGAGLGGTSAVDLERRLRLEQDAVFLPRGQRPLNTLLGRIEELRREIADLARQPDDYEAAHRERAELRERAEGLREAARRLRGRSIHLGHVRAAAPLVAELGAVEDELAAGDPSLDALPADAVAVMDRRGGALAEARATLAAIDEQLEVARDGRNGLEIDERLVAAADEVSFLRDERTARRAAEERRRDVEAAQARQAAAVEEQLARTGGWTEERLLALDDSIAAIEATRQVEGRLAEARAAHGGAEQRRRSLADDIAVRERDAPHDDGDPTLDDRAGALRELEALRRHPGWSTDGRAVEPLPAVLGLAAALVAGMVAGLPFDQPLAGGAVGALVGLIVVIAYLVRAGRGTGTGGQSDLLAERTRLLRRAGLGADADDGAIDGLRDELAIRRARRVVDREDAASLEARRLEFARLEREAERIASDLGAAQDAWHAWLTDQGMPVELTPEAARQILVAAGIARRAAVERDHQRALIDADLREQEAFEARVDALLVHLGRAKLNDASRRDAALISLAEGLDHSRAAQRRSLELAATLARLTDRRGPAAGTVAEREAAIASYVAGVGCTSPDDLRRRDAAATARRALQARARELRAGLAGIGGTPEVVAALVEEAGSGDAAATEAAHLEAQAELEEAEATEREANSRIGALNAQISQLEAAQEVGTRRQELAVLEGQAAALAREWTVRAIALRLLEETRSRYERERQPDVVRAATAHLEHITGGRYTRIVAPPGDASVRVETPGGEGRITDELSRGTAEQLYLALRFGLIEEFARHAEPLPVVMDDILVNFDADRADRAAATIRDLATRHQVLYFTCHAWTARVLDPDGARTLALA